MREIRKVAVLGAGTMGAAIAAHVANAGVPCVLLDRLPALPGQESSTSDSKTRSSLAQLGIDAALKARPAAFFVPETARLISAGNFEDHLSWIKDCDWVIECVTEDLGIKRALLQSVQPYLSPQAVASSNTSGISIASIADGLSDDFQHRWLGTHFFNPPRYMKLLEIIPTEKSLPEVVEAVSKFGDEVLGKGVVLAKDRPNFIANRIGAFVTLLVLDLMQEKGFSIEEVDALTGPVMGAPKSATFRLLDLVGLDVFAHVVNNLRDALAGDDRKEIFRLPEFFARMIDRKLLGEKTRQGFYRKAAPNDESPGESEILTLDLSTLEYRARQKPRLPDLDMAKGVEDLRSRVRLLVDAPSRAGAFYQRLFSETFHYAAMRVPEISDDIISIDNAMKWGFNWELGPFELCDAIGVEKVVSLWNERKLSTPPLVEKLLSSDGRSFYRDAEGEVRYFDLNAGAYRAAPEKPGILLLDSLKAHGREVKRNAGASLIDLGDGVLCLEFHSKMNTIGPDVVQMIHAGLKALNDQFDALVAGNQGANFSAGANLLLLALAIQEGDWDEIAEAVRAFQDANMALKYAPKPVVAAPFGLSLGGATELSLHCARVAAAAETYMGLVETGVGLIPAGGGTKEMLLRAMDAVPSDADPFACIKEVFANIGGAKVSTSAGDARKLGYLSSRDMISMSRDRQLGVAKQLALDMTRLGYWPGVPRDDIMVFGREGFSKMRLAIHLMRRAEYISEHDAVIGTQLARVLSGGGEFTAPQQVSERYLLDLEREAFLSLCGEKKTLERIQHTLKTGKPLRN